MNLPARIHVNSGRQQVGKRSPAHRAWVRGHSCSVAGCAGFPIECAHVRAGTGGGMGLKPSDRWCISLCRECHADQHRLGEAEFEKRTGLNMKRMAEQFARLSPHRAKLAEMP